MGTIESFWQTHMDMLGEKPRLDLNNSRWPIHSGSSSVPPAKLIDSKLNDCIVGDGCVIRQASLKRCVLGRGVIVHEKCSLEDSIIMDSCDIKAGTKLKRVIVDRFNTMAPKTVIGHNPDSDAHNYYIDPSGIAVIPRGVTRRFKTA